MGLLDSYQDSTDQALSVMASQPLTPELPKPKHSGWTTVPRAVAGAVAELSGNALDVSGAISQVTDFEGGELLDFSGGEMGNMSASQPNQRIGPYAKKSRVDQFKKLNTEGFDFRSGKPAYQFAQDLRPDPITAGTAENIVFSLTKGLTKAIGAGTVLGPMAGAGLFGTSEGMTTAEDLANQGVDKSTRTKVGAVTGVLNTVGVALPVVSKNLAQTAALVAVGGPGSFVAQQSATKAILQNANYDEIAAQYDPLDPVGLAVSTLVPAGFAIWARGTKTKQAAKALRFDDPALDAHATAVEQQHGLPPGLLVAIKNAGEKSNSNQVSPKGAQGVMQFIPSTWKQYGKGDPTNPADSIDAGGRYFADLMKRYDGNVDAAITEYNGGIKQARAVAEGKAPTAKETIAYLGRVKQAMATPAKPEVIPETPQPTQEHIDAAMVQNLTIARDVHEATPIDPLPIPDPINPELFMEPPTFQERIQNLSAEIALMKNETGWAETGGKILRDANTGDVVGRTQWIPRYDWWQGRPDSLNEAKTKAAIDKALNGETLKAAERRMVEYLLDVADERVKSSDFLLAPAHLTKYELKPSDGLEVAMVARASEIDDVAVERLSMQYENDDAGFMAAIKGLLNEHDKNAKTGAGGQTGERASQEKSAPSAKTQSLKPDIPVAVKDDGTHVTAAEQLDAIKLQAQEGTDTELGALDAPLLKVAAECLLS